MDTNILLESGTNELEILEFTLGHHRYGINVAKISELCPYQPPSISRLRRYRMRIPVWKVSLCRVM